MKPEERVEELSEDIDVAIREFLERHPHTNAAQIRKAMLVAGRGVCRSDAGARRAIGLVGAFVLGAVLGAVFL